MALASGAKGFGHFGITGGDVIIAVGNAHAGDADAAPRIERDGYALPSADPGGRAHAVATHDYLYCAER